MPAVVFRPEAKEFTPGFMSTNITNPVSGHNRYLSPDASYMQSASQQQHSTWTQLNPEAPPFVPGSNLTTQPPINNVIYTFQPADSTVGKSSQMQQSFSPTQRKDVISGPFMQPWHAKGAQKQPVYVQYQLPYSQKGSATQQASEKHPSNAGFTEQPPVYNADNFSKTEKLSDHHLSSTSSQQQISQTNTAAPNNYRSRNKPYSKAWQGSQHKLNFRQKQSATQQSGSKNAKSVPPNKLQSSQQQPVFQQISGSSNLLDDSKPIEGSTQDETKPVQLEKASWADYVRAKTTVQSSMDISSTTKKIAQQDLSSVISSSLTVSKPVGKKGDDKGAQANMVVQNTKVKRKTSPTIEQQSTVNQTLDKTSNEITHLNDTTFESLAQECTETINPSNVSVTNRRISKRKIENIPLPCDVDRSGGFRSDDLKMSPRSYSNKNVDEVTSFEQTYAKNSEITNVITNAYLCPTLNNTLYQGFAAPVYAFYNPENVQVIPPTGTLYKDMSIVAKEHQIFSMQENSSGVKFDFNRQDLFEDKINDKNMDKISLLVDSSGYEEGENRDVIISSEKNNVFEISEVLAIPKQQKQPFQSENKRVKVKNIETNPAVNDKLVSRGKKQVSPVAESLTTKGKETSKEVHKIIKDILTKDELTDSKILQPLEQHQQPPKQKQILPSDLQKPTQQLEQELEVKQQSAINQQSTINQQLAIDQESPINQQSTTNQQSTSNQQSPINQQSTINQHSMKKTASSLPKSAKIKVQEKSKVFEKPKQPSTKKSVKDFDGLISEDSIEIIEESPKHVTKPVVEVTHESGKKSHITLSSESVEDSELKFSESLITDTKDTEKSLNNLDCHDLTNLKVIVEPYVKNQSDSLESKPTLISEISSLPNSPPCNSSRTEQRVDDSNPYDIGLQTENLSNSETSKISSKQADLVSSFNDVLKTKITNPEERIKDIVSDLEIPIKPLEPLQLPAKFSPQYIEYKKPTNMENLSNNIRKATEQMSTIHSLHYLLRYYLTEIQPSMDSLDFVYDPPKLCNLESNELDKKHAVYSYGNKQFQSQSKADNSRGNINAASLGHISSNRTKHLLSMISGTTSDGKGAYKSNYSMASAKLRDRKTNYNTSGAVLLDDQSVELWRQGGKSSAIPNSRLAHAQLITDRNLLIQRKFRSILNKLTIEKFDELYDQILNSGMNCEEDVKCLMDLICKKAKIQHHFIPMYVRLCYSLNEDIPKMNILPEKKEKESTFRLLLVDACQQAFTEALKPIVIPENLSEEEQFEYLLFEKRQMKGTVIFVGELSKREIVAKNVITKCIKDLLDNSGEPQLEALCELLITAGNTLSGQPRAKKHLDDYMATILQLIDDETKSTRIRCLLQDVVDDWKKGWVKADKNQNKPKALNETSQNSASSVSSSVLATKSLCRFTPPLKNEDSRMDSTYVDEEFKVVGKKNKNVNKFRHDTMSYESNFKSNSYLNLSRIDPRTLSSPIMNHIKASKAPDQKLITKTQKIVKKPSEVSSKPINTSYSSKTLNESISDFDLLKESGNKEVERSDEKEKIENNDALEGRERCEDTAEDFEKIVTSVIDPETSDWAISEVKLKLNSNLPQDKLIDCLSQMIYLLVETRTQHQPILANFLLTLPKDGIISSDTFYEGLIDFLDMKSTLCDCPNLSKILTNLIINKAKEENILAENYINNLERKVQELDFNS